MHSTLLAITFYVEHSAANNENGTRVGVGGGKKKDWLNYFCY